MRLAFEVVQPRLRRPDHLDRARDHLQPLVDLALLQRQHRDVIERVGVARVLLEDRHIALHGKLVLAGPVQRQRLVDGLWRAAGVEACSYVPLARFMPQPSRIGQSVGRAVRRRGMDFA